MATAAAGPLTAPASHKSPAERARKAFAGVAEIDLPADAKSAVRRLAGSERVTPYMVYVALVCVLLHRWARQHDVAIGAPIVQRKHPELDDVVGVFVNTIVLRVNLVDTPTFGAVLRRVRDVVLDAMANEDVEFEAVLKRLGFKPNPGSTGLFSVFLTPRRVKVSLR